MLNVKGYLRKANRNKTFVSQYLVQIIDKFPDWVSVVAFYSALHFVDAHLIKHHSMQCKHHDERETKVAIHLSEIYPIYKSLFELSFRARYLRVKDNPTPGEAKDAVDKDLPEIESYVMQRMT